MPQKSLEQPMRLQIAIDGEIPFSPFPEDPKWTTFFIWL
jgi:hypothetical protein